MFSRSKDRYLFNVDDYKIVQNINKGGFGIINLVKNLKDGKEYAAKTNLIQNKEQNKLFISREVRILIHVQHPTIIRFRGFSYSDFNHEKNITILMDYMEKGSLADLISKEEKSLCPSNYDNTKRQIILIGIARGMMILHKFHIIHRDLKPENILLDADFYPYITDFGLSKFFDPSHSMSQSMTDSGTAPYMAPEVINSDHFNTKADVFAFGILMYEIVTGKRAYSNLFKGKKKLNMFQLKQKVTQGFRPEIEEGSIKKGLKIMIEKCWSANPKERPTFSELFRKLSLSNDDFLLEFESCQEPVIINDDDDDDDQDEDNLEINTKYCLDDVDYGEIIEYVDNIIEEPKSRDQQAVDKDEKIADLSNELKKLKNKTKSQESKISELESKLDNQSNKIKSLESKFSSIKETENFYKEQIEQLKAQLLDSKNKSISSSSPNTNSKSSSSSNPSSSPKSSPSSSIIDIPYVSKSNLKGIFSFFLTNSNINEEIVVKPSSLNHGENELLLDISNSTYSYCTNNKPNSFICFEFKKKTVFPSSYTIQTVNSSKNDDHLKSWVIEGSLNNLYWIQLDEQKNCSFLNGAKLFHTFTIKNNEKGFKFLRIRQTDKNWTNSNYLDLCSIEFYGKLI